MLTSFTYYTLCLLWFGFHHIISCTDGVSFGLLFGQFPLGQTSEFDMFLGLHTFNFPIKNWKFIDKICGKRLPADFSSLLWTECPLTFSLSVNSILIRTQDYQDHLVCEQIQPCLLWNNWWGFDLIRKSLSTSKLSSVERAYTTMRTYSSTWL